MKLFKQLGIAVLSVLAASNLGAQTNLVSNGSFETVNTAYNSGGGAQLLQMTSGSNTTFLPSWTVGGTGTSGYPATFNTTPIVGPLGVTSDGNYVPDGTHYLIMSNYSTNPTLWLSQTISGLTPGNTYQLSYWESASAGYGTTPRYDVSLGGTTFNGPTISTYRSWQQVTTTFVATASSELLKFNVVGIGAPQYIGLDGVSLTQVAAVPEPSAAVLVGAAGFAFLVRRRRSARA